MGSRRVLFSRPQFKNRGLEDVVLVCGEYSFVTQARAEPPPALQDTAGSERYEAMSRIYYRGAKAAIVCYGKKGFGLFL